MVANADGVIIHDGLRTAIAIQTQSGGDDWLKMCAYSDRLVCDLGVMYEARLYKSNRNICVHIMTRLFSATYIPGDIEKTYSI